MTFLTNRVPPTIEADTRQPQNGVLRREGRQQLRQAGRQQASGSQPSGPVINPPTRTVYRLLD